MQAAANVASDMSDICGVGTFGGGAGMPVLRLQFVDLVALAGIGSALSLATRTEVCGRSGLARDR
jgi:hypothetical protein